MSEQTNSEQGNSDRCPNCGGYEDFHTHDCPRAAHDCPRAERVELRFGAKGGRCRIFVFVPGEPDLYDVTEDFIELRRSVGHYFPEGCRS